MRWLDVAGCPGAGKSELCYAVWGDREVGWDGKLPPAYWKQFTDEITSLCELVQDHPTFEAVIRMNDRSAKKMASVERMEAPEGKFPVFVQTGLVQRVLGFGWRLHHMRRDINLIRRALWLMPVSVGVAFLEADLATLIARNKAREQVKETAHENRSAQVPHMLACLPIVKEVLKDRGIPTIDIDVQHQPIDAARAELLAFANQATCEQSQMGLGHQDTLLQVPPPWWRR